MKNDKWGGTSSSSDLTEDPPDVSVRFSRGLEHLRNAEVDKAKQVFDGIISEDPEYAPAFFGLSCVHIRLDAKELALKFIERTLELDPDYGEAHLVMARLLYDDGDLVGGYDHVKKAVQLGVSPNSGNELINSLIQRRSRKDDEVAEKKSVESDPSIISAEKPVFEQIDESIPSEIEIASSAMSAQSYRETEPVNQSLNNIIVSLNNLRFVIEEKIQNKWVLSVLILAFLARLYALWMMPIDWNWDSYHHWQISYFTLNIGLEQGRMWDLRGMEYLWGMVPHLIEALLLWIFRTSSLLPFRIFNLIMGSFSAVLVYLIGQEEFGWKSGILSGIIVAVGSSYVAFDITGLQDAFATFCILLSIYLSKKRPSISGIFLGIGCQSRIEYWGISTLYFIFMLIYRIPKQKKIKRLDFFYAKFLGWFITMSLFGVFLYSRTKNPIYPFYWSIYNVIGGFRGPSAGQPFLGLIITKIVNLFSPASGYFLPKLFFIITAIISSYLYLKSVKDKKDVKNIDFYITLLSFFIFRSVFFVAGGVKWLIIPFERLILIRVFQVDIALGLILLISHGMILFKNYQKLLTIIIIFLIPLSCYNIGDYSKFQESQKANFDAADTLISIWDEGTITCDNPNMVYRFINAGVPTKNIISNLYSPFYYSSTPSVGQFIDWFINNNITYIVYTGGGWSHKVVRFAQNNLPSLLQIADRHGSLTFLRVNQTEMMRYT